MKSLNINAASVSRSIHVDASLISKWKTGDRPLSSKSIYFEGILDYIMAQSALSSHSGLKYALTELFPQETIAEDEPHLKLLLRQALANDFPAKKSSENQLFSEHSNHVSALVFEQNSGRREAMDKILSYAEEMTVPGTLLMIDNENFNWILEDSTYVRHFVKRFEDLIHRGFKADIVLQLASYRSKFINLFEECSSLIFHKNINWYYIENYDEPLMNYSCCILNHAISLLNISASQSSNCSSTLVFTDNTLVIQHELMARHIISQCKSMFMNFEVDQLEGVLHEVSLLRKRGTLYSYLPSPLFASVNEQLLLSILEDNHAGDEEIARCIYYNRLLQTTASAQALGRQDPPCKVISIFHLETLLHRVYQGDFYSRSLELICEKPILIRRSHYAAELRNLANTLINNDNFKIVLASDKDGVALPSINCWCKQNIWMIQMNHTGLRLNNEYSIVHAASMKWERCLCAIPSERKEKIPVQQFLLELADSIAQME